MSCSDRGNDFEVGSVDWLHSGKRGRVANVI